jgi:hypothetical protein
MHSTLLARLFPPVRAGVWIVFAFGLAATSHAQNRPGGGFDPGGGIVPGGGIIPGGGGNVVPGGGGVNVPGGGFGGIIGGGITIVPGGGITIVPGGGVFPGGNTTVEDVRIVTEPGVVVGSTGSALAIPPEPAGVAAGATPPTAASGADVSYRWTIAGGRIVGSSTSPAVEFTAASPGAVTLTVTAMANGTFYSASAQVTAIPPTLAGAMTIPPAVAASAATIAASVPPAVNNDRTFRWTASGDAAIASGQGTPNVTLRPGGPGTKEVTCFVSIQNLTTIAVRSFLVVTGSGPPVALTVTHGAGGGTYPAGSVVDVFAHPPAAGKLFDRWTGDTSALNGGDAAAAFPHVTVTIPGAGAALAATYRDAPEWSPARVTDFNPQRLSDAGRTTTVSTTLLHHLPAQPRGLVFLLHGAGGSAGDWFARPETLLLARALVGSGYGVAALNSVDRVNATWAAQPALANNPDALNHAAALEKFVREGALTDATPVFFVGVSASADTAAGFAELLATGRPARPVKGVVLYGAAGAEGLAITSAVPHAFVLAPNDPGLGTSGGAAARANSQLLAGRGVATQIIDTAATPVHAARFRALSVTAAEFDDDDAAEVWRSLKAAELLDANNYVRWVPAAETLKAVVPARYERRLADIAAQLAIAGASQPLASETAGRVIAFLDSRVAAVPAPPPARLVNLSTRGRIAHATDSFTIGFTLGEAGTATVLLRATGPALARFGVGDAHPAPRLEVYRGANLLAANEGWDQAGSNAAQIGGATASVGAFPLAAGSRDAAMLLLLDAGNYTAVLKGVNGTTGELLAEIYDVSRNATRLRTLSALARVNAEGDLVIPGLALQGTTPRTLLVRAIGPGLRDVGLPAEVLLGDPRLTVLGGNGAPVAANNNWTQGNAAALPAAFAAAGAFPLRSTHGDAAVISALGAGTYTVQAGASLLAPGQSATAAPTGTVLVEIYEVP